MTQTFLLEIGLEEMPAHVVTPSVEQLVEKMSNFLKEERLDFSEIKSYSTPRRLAVEVVGLADKQADIQEEAKGPAKKIALDAEGNWSKAAQGFARGQGVTTDDIFFKELKGVEYVYVNKFIAGKSAQEVLQGVKEVVMDLKFPTMMRWGSNDFEYIRPIQWLVALLDNEVIDFEILTVKTGKTTRGHRFLGETTEIADATAYPAALEAQSVIADAAVRKEMIREQINALAKERNWKVDIDEDLLEEVNNLVEYPTVFAGSFADEYLQVPDEVLITSMKDHQRFFYVMNQDNELLPFFISVRNGNADHLENVIAGNEKVLTARLEDAEFFFKEDQTHTIADYVERLKNVTFHEKIGTIYEKMARVKLIAAYLAEKLGLTEQEQADVARAAEIYKFDLVTGMVGEFSELQGVMGEIYATLQGERPAVAQAIREEYMPTSAQGELPASQVGAVLSIADKLDTLQTFFAAGMIPSGSNDPYALRRQAQGLIRIIIDRGWDNGLVTLHEMAQTVAKEGGDLYRGDLFANQAVEDEFIMERVRKMLLQRGVRHDIVAAVVANPDNSFVKIMQAAQILENHLADEDFKETIEALTRVIRLAKKAPEFAVDAQVDQALFENESEKALYLALEHLTTEYQSLDLDGKYEALHALREVINAYFDETMIMVDDEKVKNNRLLVLSRLAALTSVFGDLTELNVK
ncbi:glycine--tRNA ligase subunit beta [Ligilactobacillus ceti]|uniref:Glycine--tRNA ligase beta subunit n=1 Tax=Ligilactobacillus ceti DSM 22408 TaxID=1122146 RepID=A0A0R2KPJ7_9LACO|nr:glycine--tRNA ligase subunit beta [Ligilactobacillus ceti]KRN88860.1 glycyl-tRNA synthetase beta chain [Ligilactobacillus ceti DSM 22408]